MLSKPLPAGLRQTVRCARSSPAFVLFVAAAAIALTIAACGGESAATGPTPTPGPDASGILTGAGSGSQSNVPGSNVFAQNPSTPTPDAGVATSTPPPITLEEELTSVLVDNLSADEYPRIPARDLEARFRNDADQGQSLIGKAFVIQGDVVRAGKDDSGTPYVIFKAGAGSVTCRFETISESELLRLTPDGRNVVTGKVAEWDPAVRHLLVEGCRMVRGY